MADLPEQGCVFGSLEPSTRSANLRLCDFGCGLPRQFRSVKRQSGAPDKKWRVSFWWYAMFMACIGAATPPDALHNARMLDTGMPKVLPRSSCEAITTIWPATKRNPSRAVSRTTAAGAQRGHVGEKSPDHQSGVDGGEDRKERAERDPRRQRSDTVAGRARKGAHRNCATVLQSNGRGDATAFDLVTISGTRLVPGGSGRGGVGFDEPPLPR